MSTIMSIIFVLPLVFFVAGWAAWLVSLASYVIGDDH
jgi:hypothetical protein